MRNLNFYLTMLFAFSFSVALNSQFMEQEEGHFHAHGATEEENQFVEAFYEKNAATNKEKTGTVCEFSLLYYQYHKKGKEVELDAAFQKVFDFYRKNQRLLTTQRLFEVDHESEDYVKGIENRIRQFDEDYHWYWDTPGDKNSSGDKQLGGGGDQEKATNCTNSDFEDADANGWVLGHGSYTGGGAGGININTPSANMGAMNSTGGQHCMMGPGAGNDPYTNNVVPRVYQGSGSYSMRLGDAGTGRKAARARYTFTVSPQTELFIYNYAAILQDPNHSPTQQPFLQITLTVGSASDPCGYYYQAASSSAPGYFQGTSSVRYKPWTTVSVSLSAFMGQTATLEFITADCSAGAHFGYAYLDAECLAMPSLNQTVIDCFNPQPTVYGPPGAIGYQWSGPGIVGPTNTQNITVNAPGSYSVTVTPVSGANCAYTLYTTVVQHLGQINATFNTLPSEVCLGSPINFESNYTLIGDSGPIDSINWNFGNGFNALDADSNYAYIFPDPDVYTVELAVITTNGCTDTVQHSVTVHPIPVADFTVDSICHGTANNIQEQSSIITANGDAISSWNWDFGDGTTSTLQNPSITYANESAYNITLVVESAFGCKDTITKTAAVFPNPVASFAATNVCIDDISQFTDLSSVMATNTFDYISDWTWDFGDGNGANTQNALHTYAIDGLYNVELTVLTNNGCFDDTIIPVGVFPNPVVDITHPDVCLLSPTVFSDNSTIDNTQTTSNIVGWNWIFGDGTNSNVQNPTHTYSTNGTYEVIFTVISDHGCMDTDTFEVVVHPNPVADFTIDSVCLGSASTFADLSSIDNTDGDFISNWNWDFGNGQTSTNQNPIHVYADENLYNVSLSVTSNRGCVTTVSKTTAIYPNPTVDFQVADVCIDFMSHFTDQSTISNNYTQNDIVSWSWDLADGNTSNIASPSHLYSSPGTYNVSLTLTSNHNCSANLVKPVQIFPEPVASFIGTNLDGCAPLCIGVTSTSTVDNPSTIDNYKWTLSDGTTYSGANPLLADCLHNKGSEPITYGLTLEVTSNHGCVNEHSESDYIRVLHVPDAKFYYTPPNPDIIDSKVFFHNTSKNADSYLWSIGDVTSTTETNPIVDFPGEANTYYTELVAYTEEGCTDTARAVIDVKDKLIFYVPNTFTPDNDEFNEVFKPIFASGFDPRSYTMFIFNRWGEKLFESHDAEVGWDGTYGLESGEKVKDGTYIWKISFKETMSDRRHNYSGYVNILK